MDENDEKVAEVLAKLDGRRISTCEMFHAGLATGEISNLLPSGRLFKFKSTGNIYHACLHHAESWKERGGPTITEVTEEYK